MIETEYQKFAPSNLISLYQLDTTSLGGPILYFTSSQDTSGPVTFNGQEYPPMPVETSGFEISSTGSLPNPTIKLLNVPAIQSIVIAYGDAIGATLYRIRTFETFLDDGETPDPTAHYPIDIWTVDRKSNMNKVFIEWELAAATDQQGRQIPGRQVLLDFCSQIYRFFQPSLAEFDYSRATCPYTGTNYFDSNDVAQSSPSADVCGKKLTSCRKRFGTNAQLPTHAFPGISAIQR